VTCSFLGMERVASGFLLELPHPFEGRIDLPRRDRPFLGPSVRDDRGVSTVEEVKGWRRTNPDRTIPGHG
jgi:hypothetical protein